MTVVVVCALVVLVLAIAVIVYILRGALAEDTQTNRAQVLSAVLAAALIVPWNGTDTEPVRRGRTLTVSQCHLQHRVVTGCTDAFINATIRPPAGIGRSFTGLLRRPATQQENLSACDRRSASWFSF